MNIISFEKAYCLYPRATLEGRRSLICDHEGPNVNVAVQKYERRGWQMVMSDDLDWSSDLKPNFHIDYGTFRWMGDSFCWTLNLDVTQIPDRLRPDDDSTPLPHDPVAATSWSLTSDFRGTVDTRKTSEYHLYFKYIFHYKDILRSLDHTSSDIGPLRVMQRGK